VDSERVDPFQVYRAVRQADVGMQLERVFRAICYVLHRWKAYGERVADGHDGTPARNRGHDHGRLNLIEFDKLANIVCRLWTNVFQRTALPRLGEINSLSPDEVQKLVRFKPPFEEVPGLHGPGEARAVSGSRHVYLVKMLRDLDSEGVGYFTFSSEDGREEEDLAVSSDDAGTTFIAPGLLVSEDDVFWDGFTRAEVDFLRLTASAICHLSPAQIRALGTHKDHPSTVDDAKREVNWARRKAEEIAKALGVERRVALKDAYRLFMFVNEARRKTEQNEQAYREAFKVLATELHDATGEAFLASHRAADEIWKGDEITDIRAWHARAIGPASALVALATMQQVLVSRDDLPPRRAQHVRQQWDSARVTLSRHFDVAVPEDVANAFTADGLVQGSLASSLGSVLLRI
jgi:hypothetical protein